MYSKCPYRIRCTVVRYQALPNHGEGCRKGRAESLYDLAYQGHNHIKRETVESTRESSNQQQVTLPTLPFPHAVYTVQTQPSSLVLVLLTPWPASWQSIQQTVYWYTRTTQTQLNTQKPR